MQEIEKHVMNEKDLQMLKELHLMDDDFFSEAFEYSNAIVHAFQKFKAPFSGKIVHIFPEQSEVI